MTFKTSPAKQKYSRVHFSARARACVCARTRVFAQERILQHVFVSASSASPKGFISRLQEGQAQNHVSPTAVGNHFGLPVSLSGSRLHTYKYTPLQSFSATNTHEKKKKTYKHARTRTRTHSFTQLISERKTSTHTHTHARTQPSKYPILTFLYTNPYAVASARARTHARTLTRHANISPVDCSQYQRCHTLAHTHLKCSRN